MHLDEVEAGFRWLSTSGEHGQVFLVGGKQGFLIWNTVLLQKLSTKVLEPSCRVINISQHTRFPSKGKVEGHKLLHNLDHIVGPRMEPFGTRVRNQSAPKVFGKNLIGSKDMIPDRNRRWCHLTAWHQMGPKVKLLWPFTGLFHSFSSFSFSPTLHFSS